MSAYRDTRPVFFTTLDWVSGLLTRLATDQLAWPTPDKGWTVADLADHIVAVTRMIPLPGADKIASAPAGTPHARAFTLASGQAKAAWSLAGPDALAESTRVPPDRSVSKAEALEFFAQEFMVHGWDLATALNQPAEAPAEAAQQILAYAKANMPDKRPQGGPFGPPVEPPLGAGPTRQLAAYLGR
ncbi:MAG: TIGR03086 family protein [Bifidobacteriaceae bacterium]|jgi:uncharacterized protein (TIGR03086 family)|nr:TIGR03086 family protein [Bifidobacteriaceae bacterium]